MLRLSPPNATASVEPSHRAPRLDLGPLFDLSTEALVVQDVASRRIALWNRAAERLLGYSAADAVGRCIAMLFPPAVARLHQERLAHFARTGDADILTGRDALQIPVLDRRGEEIRVELSTAALEQGDGRFVLLTLRDARSTKRVELHALELARAQAALAEAESRLDARDRLLRDHPRDVETALLKLSSAAARLMRPRVLDDPDRARVAARLVHGRAEAAQRVIRDATDSVAIETDSFELQLERINLVPLVSHVTAEARRRGTAHRLNVAVPQGLTVLADASRLERVLADLIDFAVRRNPRGCWIDVDVRRPLGGLARIEVRDYGRALSDRERAALPTGSAPSRRWSVLQAIVRLHGGTLAIEQPAEGGCRVAVTLSTNGGRVTAV